MNHRCELREAGDAALLLQWPAAIDPAINARVIATAAAVRQQELLGVRDVVPTFHSVAVHFDPLVGDPETIAAALRSAATVDMAPIRGRHHEIPVLYGGDAGPDLEHVAALAGMTPDDVARRHAAVTYRVFMLGFQPGFAYLGVVDPVLAVPRRPTPRVRVPAGSVGIAARQTAVYPSVSPGGWHLIGRAAEPVIDAASEMPRFASGDTVAFVSTRSAPAVSGALKRAPAPAAERRIEVVRPGLFTTIQNSGVWGRQHLGFPVSGAMDTFSHNVANALVGNRSDAAALEVTIAGPEVRFEQQTIVAVAGADLSATLDDAAVPLQTAIAATAGSVLRFGVRRAGARAYVAFDGGLTHAPRWPVVPLAAGDILGLDAPIRTTSASPIDQHVPIGGARLRVLAGPQTDRLPSSCLDAVLATRFTISSQSNRIGYRLTGGAIPGGAGEMISDATFPGGVQVTPSGEAILLMADRQTTGGYPQVATVISADLRIAAQLAPGDWVEFEACTRHEALAALRAQHSILRHVP